MKEKSKNTRLQAMIRNNTMKLLKDYCEMEELDISRAVDELLSGRLKYLDRAENKALKTTKNEYKSKNKEWVEDFWRNYKDE